jgi:hypothetical protein
MYSVHCTDLTIGKVVQVASGYKTRKAAQRRLDICKRNLATSCTDWFLALDGCPVITVAVLSEILAAANS